MTNLDAVSIDALFRNAIRQISHPATGATAAATEAIEAILTDQCTDERCRRGQSNVGWRRPTLRASRDDGRWPADLDCLDVMDSR